MAEPHTEFLAAGLTPDLLSVVIGAALGSLRADVTQAWVDAFTQGEWRPEQRSDVELLLGLERQELAAGRRRRQTGMGIEVDLSRDDDLALLVRLTPYSIHSEAWSGTTAVFSSSDAGDHAWFALTAEQVEATASGLTSRGYAFQNVLRRHE